MKFYVNILLSLFVLFFLNFVVASSLTPVGSWIQISDKTGKPHSTIKIYSHHQQLFGKVVKAFPQNGVPPRKFCDRCSGSIKNAPIIGLTIMRHFMRRRSNVWSGGTILDPDSGKVYRCKLTLIDQGKKLYVRGYVGILLFGRTQTWIRENIE